ncbi:MAG: hypothetical protein D6723_02375 [Acidobacteria bacterium]|nr:MAG: hypothetical protein D6723_02375 [Acidobacteriota bacterium]
MSINFSSQSTASRRRIWSTVVIISIICLLYLAVQVAYMSLVPINRAHDEWDHIAKNLVTGRGYASSWPKTYIRTTILGLNDYHFPLVPTATRVPVPVLYFALMFHLFGISDQSLLIGQGIVGVLTCALLFIIALEVFGDRRVAIMASLVWVFYVPQLWMSNSRYSEPLTTFLLACLTYVLIVALRTRSVWRFGLAGVLWGLGVLARPTLMVLPLFLSPCLFIILRRQLRFAALACIITVLGGALIISPWVYRNYRIFDAPVISTLGGRNLFRDHYFIDRDDYLNFRGTFEVDIAAKEMFDRRFGSVAAVEMADNSQLLVDRVYWEEAIIKIRRYPGRYVLLSLIRILRLWFNVGYGTAPSWRSYLILIGHLALAGLVVRALVSYRGDWVGRMAPVFAVVVQQTLTYMAIACEFRYSIPLTPYPLLIGCYTLVRIFEADHSTLVNRMTAYWTTAFGQAGKWKDG